MNKPLLIAEITYTKAFTKWVPNDERVEAVECNIYTRRAFGKMPEGTTVFKLRIWNMEPETENPVHKMVSTKHASGRTSNAFLSHFKDSGKSRLLHHHMSHYWMKVLDPGNDLTGGSVFFFELEAQPPKTAGGFPCPT